MKCPRCGRCTAPTVSGGVRQHRTPTGQRCNDPAAQLNANQLQALEILNRRRGLTTYTARRNGATYIATGSAAVLRRLGLATVHTWTGTATITQAGQDLLAKIHTTTAG